MRGAYAWLGAAIILLALGAVATVGTQDAWLDGYGIIAYFLVPLAFLPFAAGAVASPRVNRFVESLFTAPVERSDWFFAKALVLLTLAGAYYVAILPMALVYIAHIGMPFLLKELLLWTPFLLVASTAVGLLVGVLFIGRSIAPPAATGVGILLAYAGMAPLQELLVSQGNGATRTGSLTLSSPAVLLKNAFGFTLITRSIPDATAMTWVSIAVVVLGSFALAAWVFLRAQGVENWETTRAKRWAITFAILAIFFFPILFADRNYDKAAPAANNAPALPGMGGRGGISSLALAQPGAALPGRCCNAMLNRDEPIGTDKSTRRDLLILLPVETSQPVDNLDIHISAGAGMTAVADSAALAAAGKSLETHTYMNDQGPMATDGHHVVTGWVARVPLTLTPTNPWDIGGDRYPLAVAATYRLDGDAKPRVLNARGAVNAQVASAIYEMGAVSFIFPALCLFAAIRRWRLTR